jgi:peptidoglycan/xylan/chitin deacetylase (PgdA/CDA1 family)
MRARDAVKKCARQAVSALACYGGYCQLSQLMGAGGAHILSYHGVNDNPANTFAVAAREFHRQMQFLSERCTVVSVDRLVEMLRGGQALAPRTVAVTIDDGYSDAYTHAFPILKRWNIPASVFIAVGLIGSTSARLPRTEFVSWEHVIEMSQNGIHIGSHAVTHDGLTRIPYQEARLQLEASKAELEAAIGQRVTGFSYPYGGFRDFDRRLEEIVRQAGYTWAVSGISGSNRPGSDLYALRRTKVERDDSLSVYARSVRGALDPWVLVDRFGWFLQKKH